MGNTIVLFEVTVKNGRMDDYLKMVGSLKESLANAEGFIVFLLLPRRENCSVCPYGKMKNVFQNGGTLPHTVWRKNTGE